MPHVGNFPERGHPKPLSIGPGAFVPGSNLHDWEIQQRFIKNRTALTDQYFYASVILPQGATVTKLTLHGYRDDVDAVLMLRLGRFDKVAAYTDMATVLADWTDGYGSGYDDSIDDPVIDNENYTYCLAANLNPNDSVEDVSFRCATIDWN